MDEYFVDNAERIQFCQQCKFKECVNCFQRGYKYRQEAEIQELWKQGLTMAEIMDKLGVKYAAVHFPIAKLFKSVDPKVSKHKQIEEQFDELYKQGLTDSEIARIINCTSTAIGSYRRSLGLPINKHTKREKIRELNMQGYSDAEIAQIIGSTQNSVAVMRLQMNLAPNKKRKRKYS